MWFSSDVCPIAVLANFTSKWENPSYIVEPPRGGNPATKFCSMSLSSGGYPKCELCYQGSERGKSLQRSLDPE